MAEEKKKEDAAPAGPTIMVETNDQPAAPGSRTSSMRRQLHVNWYGFTGWFLSGSWVARLFLTVNSLALVALPLLKIGWKWGVGYSVWWLSTGSVKAWRDLSPARLKELKRNTYERNLLFFKLVQRLNRLHRASPSPEEIREYQQDVLHLLVSYVRDHRRDSQGVTIFANLLVESGDEMVVVARDTWSRNSTGRAPKAGTLAHRSLVAKEAQWIGDLYVDFPNTPAGKPYRSIMTIPVFLGPQVVGVVSIDSSRPYHFDGYVREFVAELNPYVSLLAWTLDPEHHRSAGKAEV